MKKTLTKVLASLLAVLMLVGALPFASVAAEENTLPEKPWGYNRYYFYQPEEWINDYSDRIGIYWWEGTDCCDAWPGYVACEADVEGVYYYDVPKDVSTIIWNNAIDGGTDDTLDIYYAAKQTKNIGSEYYDIDENVNYPNGTENFDEMIYVVDIDKTETNDFTGLETYVGEWYYYYGNGEYGFETVEENSNKVVEMKYVGEEIVLYEGVDGWIEVGTDEETGEEYKYSTYSDYESDIKLEIIFEDGTTQKIEYSDIAYDYNFKFTDNQKTEPWNPGVNSFFIEYRGVKLEIPVTIIENPVKSIELAEDGNIELIENIDGYLNDRYDDETDEYVEYFRYSYSVSDVVIRINYKDGTSEEISLYDLDDCDYNDDQYDNPWGLGEHSCTLEYMGCKLEVPITVVENPVKSIELVDDGNIELIENVDGYMSDRYDDETDEFVDFFCYSYNISDAVIRINYKDGTSEESSVHDLDDYDYNDDQYDNPWGLGEHSCIFEYTGYELEISVAVVENPVESIELVDDGNIEVIENVDGYMSDRYDYETDEFVDFFCYSYSISDVVIRINYKDGTSEESSVHDLDDYDYNDDQYDNPWGLGEHSCTLKYMGYKLQVPVAVVESPVKSIELVDDANIELIENADGYLSERYDDETDTYVDYFRYTYDVSDVIVRICYKDGTSEELSLYEIENYDFSDDQHKNPWGLGEHSCIISYMDCEIEVPVAVVKSHVVSIELVYDGDIEVVENVDGYYSTYYDENDNEVEFFEYTNYSNSDVEIKINYDDGTSVTFTLDELWNEENYYTDSDQAKKPWVLGSDNFFTVYYMDKTVDVPVTVVKNTVAGLEVVSDGDIEVVENIDGYITERYDEELDDFVEYFKYDYNTYDVTFKITYTDGTSEVVDYLPYRYFDDNQYDEPWGLGEHICTVKYMGFEVEVPVTVVENPVKSIEIVDDADIEVIELVDGYYTSYTDEETGIENKYFEYSYSYADVELKINYTDGTSETVKAYEIYDDDSFSEFSDQENKPWTKGGENFFTIEYMGYSVDVPVSIIDNPVAGLEIVSDGDIEVIENVDGYMDERYDEELDDYVEYFRYSFSVGEAVVKVVYTDGSSEEFDVSDLEDGSVSSSQDEVPWTLGENSCTLTYKGYEVEIPVTVVPNKVESIEIVDDGHIELVENIDGYYEKYNDNKYLRKYFKYSYYNLDDIVFKANYTDGTSETLNVYDVNDYDYYDNQSENHWAIGGEHNYFTFEYMNCTTKVPVYIIENPIERIEMASSDVTLYEGVDGYYTNYYYEEDKNEYFYYSLDWDKLSMTVYYKDGTKETDILSNFNGRYLNEYSDQENKWNIGEKHEFTVDYYGCEAVLEVTIAESPVEKIELVKGTDQTYVEYANGWFGYRYINETGERERYFYYDILDHSDAQIKIYYKDGTTEVAFVQDEVLRHDILCYSDQSENHWAPGKNNVAIISFMDAKTELPVKFGESDVESISLIGAPIRIEENTNGYWRTVPDGEGESEYYYYYLNDILKDREFEVKYKDGTKEIVSIDDVAVDWETQYFENWLPGNKNTVSIACDGGLLNLSVNILSEDALTNGTYGDVTCDGKVNIKDATHIQKYAAKLAELTDAEFTFADVNTDGKVNVKDATAIQKHLAKIDTGLPIEKPVA